MEVAVPAVADRAARPSLGAEPMARIAERFRPYVPLRAGAHACGRGATCHGGSRERARYLSDERGAAPTPTTSCGSAGLSWTCSLTRPENPCECPGWRFAVGAPTGDHGRAPDPLQLAQISRLASAGRGRAGTAHIRSRTSEARAGDGFQPVPATSTPFGGPGSRPILT